MSKWWTRKKPTEEGWYFWKKNTRIKDLWRWSAYYVMEPFRDEKEMTFWEAGTDVHAPKGGWWKKIIT